MEQKSTSRKNKGKIVVLLLFIVSACIALLAFGRDAFSIEAKTPNVPEFSFENVGPCLEKSPDIVESFHAGDQQFICADMKTSEPTAYLELHVFTSNMKKQVYVDGKTFPSGPIYFVIYPPLPPGKYWAKIAWSRPALVDFEFEVVDE